MSAAKLLQFLIPVTLCYIVVIQALPLNETSPGDDIRIIFDWRDKGVISPATNQGQMGSVMAVCKTEEVESMYAISHQDKLVRLSTNQVIDCCNNMTPNFDCIQKLGGLCSSADYGVRKGYCPPVNCTQYGNISGTRTLPHGDEEGMIQAIKKSPLLAYINASLMSFQVYVGGVYADLKCTEQGLDHVVQIVGYGVQGKDNGFWIVKNSWGQSWGLKGYIYMQRGHNMCGIASRVFYPY